MLRYDLLSRFTFLLSYRFYVIDSDCIILVVINKELRNHSPQAFSQYLLGTQVGITVMKFTFLNWLFDIFVPCNIVLLLCEISILHPAEGLFHVY